MRISKSLRRTSWLFSSVSLFISTWFKIASLNYFIRREKRLKKNSHRTIPFGVEGGDLPFFVDFLPVLNFLPTKLKSFTFQFWKYLKYLPLSVHLINLKLMDLAKQTEDFFFLSRSHPLWQLLSKMVWWEFKDIANISKYCEYSKRLRIFQKIANIPKDCEYSERLRIFQKIANTPKDCKYFERLRIFRNIANIPKDCEYSDVS